MHLLAPVPATSELITVGAASVTAAAAMTAKERWQLVSSTALMFKQAATAPTAALASGSTYLPANTPIVLDGGLGAKVALIQFAAGGSATLTKMRSVTP